MTRLLRLLAAEVRHAAVMAGYWVRPYDMVLDARRWRWQPAGRCGWVCRPTRRAVRFDLRRRPHFRARNRTRCR